ncbi:MAG: hypothetical protein FWD36_02095 [Treponema sp.]|nr:hypothetical protein [Treponema sp.]
MFIDSKVCVRVCIWAFLVLNTIYSASAQQINSRFVVVPAGYRIIGSTNPSDESLFNNTLESILSSPEFASFMELAAIRPMDLSRIRTEVGRNDLQLVQKFDYTVFGDITLNSNRYEIRTVLIDKTSRNIQWYANDVSDFRSVIEDHGKKIAAFLKEMQLDVTMELILDAERESRFETALRRLRIYKFKYGDSIMLQDIEERLTQRLGKWKH